MNSLRKYLFPLSLCGYLAAMSVASATDYKANDVVEFFTKNATQGKTRAICVGTSQECEKKKAPPEKGFDLLVQFDFNSDVLTHDAQANLKEFARALSDPRLSVARFSVEGHTDSKGTETYNQTLSERRAQAVVSFLVRQGLAVDRFIAKGLGETSPRTSDPLDPENRRVETHIILR